MAHWRLMGPDEAFVKGRTYDFARVGSSPTETCQGFVYDEPGGLTSAGGHTPRERGRFYNYYERVTPKPIETEASDAEPSKAVLSPTADELRALRAENKDLREANQSLTETIRGLSEMLTDQRRLTELHRGESKKKGMELTEMREELDQYHAADAQMRKRMDKFEAKRTAKRAAREANNGRQS